jgi:hypothetical protein
MFARKRLQYNNELCCRRGPGLDLIRRTVGARVERLLRESVKRRLVAGYSPNSNEVSVEAEESLLLEAVTRELLLKRQQAENTQRVL